MFNLTSREKIRILLEDAQANRGYRNKLARLEYMSNTWRWRNWQGL
jgi:hypothetical protein